MSRNKKRKSTIKYLFLFVFLLAISVVATSIITIRLMNKYYFDAAGAIDISQNNPNAQQEQMQEASPLNADVSAGGGWQLLQTDRLSADKASAAVMAADMADMADMADVVDVADVADKAKNCGVQADAVKKLEAVFDDMAAYADAPRVHCDVTKASRAAAAEKSATEKSAAEKSATVLSAEKSAQTDTKSSRLNGLAVLDVKSKPSTKGFVASSDSTVWTTNTKVDIFKSSYTNKLGQMTVKSDDGDKVIAPGTSNSFVFKLSNTSDVPMVYELDIDAYITPDGLELPVKARLSRYDNHWVVGDKHNWVDTATLNNAADDGVLGSGKYLYYTLDWEWPFEVDDVYDTLLGNAAVNDDLSLTIVINTRAAATEDPSDPDADKGITLPDTGDSASVVIWGTVAACSLVTIVVTLIFMLFIKRDDDDEEDGNAEAAT